MAGISRAESYGWAAHPTREKTDIDGQGFSYAHNTQNAFHREMSDHPKRAKRFANAMSMVHSGNGFEPDHLVKAYHWDAINPKTFVDIGGSSGELSIAFAEQVKSVECIVQDLPSVISEAKLDVPAKLADRVRFMEHDFFTEQPVKGADVYFLRLVLHEWSDKYCVKILQNLVQALTPGALIIVSELILPQPGAMSFYQEWALR